MIENVLSKYNWHLYLKKKRFLSHIQLLLCIYFLDALVLISTF